MKDDSRPSTSATIFALVMMTLTVILQVVNLVLPRILISYGFKPNQTPAAIVTPVEQSK